ncbi:hypothetical protein FHY16_001035 [Xanthomonas campestris]|nr:hypothetical protein [Xanthomonas euroxanthea]
MPATWVPCQLELDALAPLPQSLAAAQSPTSAALVSRALPSRAMKASLMKS